MKGFLTALGLTLLAVGLAVLALLAIAFIFGCSGAPKPLVTEHVITVEKHVPCARRPPPDGAPVPRPTCDAKACSWPLVDAAQLADNVEALLDWARETWDLCAPATASQPVN